MYLNFKDICMIVLKTIILTIITVLIAYLFNFNYQLGMSYCDILEIPYDFTLTINSVGMALEIAIVLSVVELIAFYFIIKFLRKFRMFNLFYNFISLDCLKL